jgi:hypothetical protein
MFRKSLLSLVFLLPLFALILLPAAGAAVMLTATVTPSPLPPPTWTPTPIAEDELIQIFPPTSGELLHDEDDNLVSQFETGMIVANFVAEARFYNPYGPDEGIWDYGFFFRTNAQGQFRLAVTSSTTWQLTYFAEGDFLTLATGSVDNLDIFEEGSNLLRIEVEDRKGLFFVNGSEIAVLDLSFNTGAGEISIVTASFVGYEITGAVTRYEDFTIWSVGPPPTLTPTATPYIVPSARVGENRGEIPESGGDVWTYQGRSGEVLTIEVLADNPSRTSADEEYDPDGLDALVIVYAPDGTRIAENDDAVPGETTDSRIEDLVLPVDGIYQIEVRSWEDRSGGAYTLVIESDDSDGLATLTIIPSPTLPPTFAPPTPLPTPTRRGG